jgi:hypothetical protein
MPSRTRCKVPSGSNRKRKPTGGKAASSLLNLTRLPQSKRRRDKRERLGLPFECSGPKAAFGVDDAVVGSEAEEEECSAITYPSTP